MMWCLVSHEKSQSHWKRGSSQARGIFSGQEFDKRVGRWRKGKGSIGGKYINGSRTKNSGDDVSPPPNCSDNKAKQTSSLAWLCALLLSLSYLYKGKKRFFCVWRGKHICFLVESSEREDCRTDIRAKVGNTSKARQPDAATMKQWKMQWKMFSQVATLAAWKRDRVCSCPNPRNTLF